MSDNQFEDCYFGTVTVGERGQVVIPSDIRKKLNIQSGEKLIVMSHPNGDGLMIFRIDSLRQFMNQIAAGLNKAELSQEENDES